jgi:hypothetical protein
MKKKLNVLTCDAWWDTDITVLPSLSMNFNTKIWVISEAQKMKYPEKYISEGIEISHTIRKFKRWSLANLFLVFKIWISILKTKNYTFLYEFLCD